MAILSGFSGLGLRLLNFRLLVFEEILMVIYLILFDGGPVKIGVEVPSTPGRTI